MVSDFGKGMGMTGIDPLAADQGFFGVIFEHIVGVVGPVGQGHAAARMVGVSIGNSKLVLQVILALSHLSYQMVE